MALGLVLVMLVAGVVLLAGVVGLVLLIVGLVKRRAALWVAGIIGIVLAGLVVLVAVPLGWLLYAKEVHRRDAEATRADEVMRPAEESNYARTMGDRGTARIEGVAFEVLQMRGSNTTFSSRSNAGLLPRRAEGRYEARLGDVRIVVEKRDGRLTFSVNDRDCGRVEPGDRVTVTEDRAVLVNDEPVGEGPRPEAPDRGDEE